MRKFRCAIHNARFLSNGVLSGRGRAVFTIIAVIGWCAAIFRLELLADQVAEPGSPPKFSEMAQDESHETFRHVLQYVNDFPEAEDAAAARKWLFTTARAHGWEADVLPIAETVLAQGSEDSTLLKSARRLQAVGLARIGRLQDALLLFEEQLNGIRLRTPDDSVEMALDLVAQAQLADDQEAAKEILGQLKRAYFLNAEVRQLCEDRLSRLELVGHPAPEMMARKLDGKRGDLKDFSGQVVLLDFWATNCRPCLEEFPALRELHAEFHERGFEILGVSFDRTADLIDRFQEEWELPWPLFHDPQRLPELRKQYRVRTIPALFLIDRRGQIASVDLKGPDLRQGIEQLLTHPADD